MIADNFNINGKNYTIKSTFTLGDKRKINILESKFNDLVDSTLDDNSKALEYSRLANEQDELMVFMLSKMLGLTQNELEELSYPDEVSEVFRTIIQISSTPKKKESKPSDLPISPEIQQSLK